MDFSGPFRSTTGGRMKRLLVLVFLSIIVSACGEGVGRADVDRYVRGENPGAVVLSGPSPEMDSRTTHQTVDTYILCTDTGVVRRYNVERDTWYREPNNPQFEDFESVAVCGDRLKALLKAEGDLRLISDTLLNSGLTAEDRLQVIARALERR